MRRLAAILRLSLAPLGCVVVFCVVAFAHPLLAQETPPEDGAPEFRLVTFSGSDAVQVTGATPSGEVAILGVGRQQVGFLPTTTRFERRLTVDGDGTVEAPLGEPLPAWSVWTAVDLASGSIAVASPEGAPVREIDFPARGLGAAARFLDDERQRLEFLVVRPELGAGNQPNPEEEVGAWGLSVGDGGESDRDGETDGAIRLSFLDLRPLGNAPPSPERLQPGDVILGVDGQDLSFYTVRLAAPPEDGSQGEGVE